jgi:hypothetical protein
MWQPQRSAKHLHICRGVGSMFRTSFAPSHELSNRRFFPTRINRRAHLLEGQRLQSSLQAQSRNWAAGLLVQKHCLIASVRSRSELALSASQWLEDHLRGRADGQSRAKSDRAKAKAELHLLRPIGLRLTRGWTRPQPPHRGVALKECIAPRAGLREARHQSKQQLVSQRSMR